MQKYKYINAIPEGVLFEQGDEIRIIKSSGSSYRWEDWKVAANGTLYPASMIEDEWMRLDQLTQVQISKLAGLKTQSEISQDIQSSKDYTDEKVKQTVAETIPVSGTVLPRGSDIPEYITTVGKAELYGGTGGTTYTNTGRPDPDDKFIVEDGKVATGFYDKNSDTWSLGSSVPLPKENDNRLFDGTSPYDSSQIDDITESGIVKYASKTNTTKRTQLVITDKQPSGNLYQLRITGEGGKFNLEERTKIGASWSAFSRLNNNWFAGSFSAESDLDTIWTQGVYVRRPDGGASSQILYVRNEASTGNVYQRRTGMGSTVIDQWRSRIGGVVSAWTNVIPITLQEKDSINSSLTSLNNSVSSEFSYHGSVVGGEYIKRSDGTIGSDNGFSRTSPVKLSDLGEVNDILVDIGNFGASALPIAYYSSDVISNANFLGGEIATISNTALAKQIIGYKMTPPATATHVVFSCYKDYYFKLRKVQQLSNLYVSQSKDSFKAKIQIDNGVSANPFVDANSEAGLLFKRGGILNNITSDAQPLFIIIGQSNADGRAPQSTLPSGVLDANNKLSGYKMWNSTLGQWQDYQLGVNTGAATNTDTRFSFDIFFMKKFLEANPTKTAYAIRHTRGGIPITEKGGLSPAWKWQPKTELLTAGMTSMCDQLLAKVKSAIAKAAEQGIKLVPVCILYHQGEGDADKVAVGGVTDYPVNLTNLISWTRGLFMSPTLPVINGKILPYNNNYILINNVFDNLNSVDRYFKTVDMTGHQTDIGDGLHYDAPALQYMGEKMFEYFNELKGSDF